MPQSNKREKKKYSVCLVYTKQLSNGQISTVLYNHITYAYNDNEALGRAITECGSQENHSLSMKLIIEVPEPKLSELKDLLKESALHIEYLHKKFKEPGVKNENILSKIEYYLK